MKVMSYVKEESIVKGDEEENFVNCNSRNKTAYMDENDDSQEEDEDADSQASLTYSGKNSKAVLSDKLTFRLIKEYKCRPCLWQKNYEGETSFTQKQKAIEEIAQSLNLSSDLVKEKLRSLRVIFNQNVKKTERKRGSGGTTRFKPRWRFYEALMFLQKANIENAKPSNQCDETKRMQTREISVKELNDTATRDKNYAVASDPIVTMEDEYCSDIAPSVEDEHHSSTWCPTPQPQPPKASNLLEDFGKYVALTLSQIDDEVVLKKAQCQIQLVLSAAIAEHAKKHLSIISAVNSNSKKKS